MKVVIKLFSLTTFFIFLWIAYCFITLPNLNGLGNKTREPSISVTDKKNNFIGSIGDVYGGLLDANKIPENLLKAVVVLEDKRFFEHPGVDFTGLFRATIQNLKEM